MTRTRQRIGEDVEQLEEVEFAILRGLIYLRREASGADLPRLAAAIGNVLADYLETDGETRG